MDAKRGGTRVLRLSYTCRMPTVTIRLSATEREALDRDARIRGISVSEIVREALGMRDGGIEGRVDDIEQRLADLERMAGVR